MGSSLPFPETVVPQKKEVKTLHEQQETAGANEETLDLTVWLELLPRRWTVHLLHQMYELCIFHSLDVGAMAMCNTMFRIED